MKKIPTLFVRDPEDMRRLTRKVHPDCQWVLDGEGVPTRKYDGTCVMLDEDGQWWARREVKRDKTEPRSFVEVEHDTLTGKRVGWEPIAQSPFVKAHAEAVSRPELPPFEPGTYELCGPKVNGNPEGLPLGHVLFRHGTDRLYWFGNDVPRDYDGLREALGRAEIEGIVWHHPDGRMAKIKRRDVMDAASVEGRVHRSPA